MTTAAQKSARVVVLSVLILRCCRHRVANLEFLPGCMLTFLAAFKGHAGFGMCTSLRRCHDYHMHMQ